MDADFVHGGFEADFIALTMMVTAFDSASAHPYGEGMWVVIAARFGRFLRDRKTTKFTAPDDERLIEQPALFQIGDESGDRLITFQSEATMITGDVVVTVPTLLILHAA